MVMLDKTLSVLFGLLAVFCALASISLAFSMESIEEAFIKGGTAPIPEVTQYYLDNYYIPVIPSLISLFSMIFKYAKKNLSFKIKFIIYIIVFSNFVFFANWIHHVSYAVYYPLFSGDYS